jgi:hypothetical protein
MKPEPQRPPEPPLPPMGPIVAIIIGAVLLFVFASRFILIELAFTRLGSALIVAALTALAITGTGFAVRTGLARVLKAPPTPRPLAFDFVIGYPLFGTLCFLIGLLSVSPTTMLIPLILLAIAGGFAVHASVGTGGQGVPEPLTRSGSLALVLLVLIGTCAFLLAQAPPSSLDEMAYHLAVPHLWSVAGRAIELPLLSHSYFPLGVESADLPAFAVLGIDGGYASHFVHLLAAVAATWLLFSWLRRRVSVSMALVVTVAIVSTPALANTAGWSLVEWPLAGLFIAALIVLEDRELDSVSLAAILGAGLLTKYTFVPFAGVMLLAALLRRARPGSARKSKVTGDLLAGGLERAQPLSTFDLPPVSSLLTAAGIGAAFGSVFYLRNLILTGNPVAPFLSRLRPEVSGYRLSATIGKTFADYLFSGRFVDEALGMTMLLLAFLALVALPKRTFSKTAVWLVALIVVVLFLAAPSARIFLPYLMVLAMYGGVALAHTTRLLRIALTALLLAGAVAQTFAVAYLTSQFNPFGVLDGSMTDAQYLQRVRPSFASIDWIDQRLPATGRTLVIGVNELYPFTRPVRGGGNFDGKRVTAYLESPTLLEQLRRDGITHVAVINAPPPETGDIKETERGTNLSTWARENLRRTLSDHATPVAAGSAGTVFALK